MPGAPLLNGAAPPCAAAGRGANSLRPPVASPVAARPFRKLRREPKCFCGSPASHSLHMLFSSPVQVILHDGATNDGHSSRWPTDRSVCLMTIAISGAVDECCL